MYIDKRRYDSVLSPLRTTGTTSHSLPTLTMFFNLRPIMLSLLMVLSTWPLSAAAANCRAVGTWVVNSAGFGPGGTTNTNSATIELYRGDQVVGKANHKVCTDIYSVTSQLPFTFGWAANCSLNTIKWVCHSLCASR